MAKKDAAKKESAKKELAKREPAGKSGAKKDAGGKGVVKKAPAKKGVKKAAVKEPAMAAKKTAPAVLTTTDIGDHLAATFDIPKSHAKIYLDEAVALIGKHLKKGTRIRMTGFGVFQVKKRAARKGRNPATGDEIKIKASKRVVFAAARDLKAKL